VCVCCANHVTGWTGSNALTHTAGEPYVPVVTDLKKIMRVII